MESQTLLRLLQCLDFPYCATFDISSKEKIIMLVSWLEDRKIRYDGHCVLDITEVNARQRV